MADHGAKIFSILRDMNHDTLTYQQSGLLLDILNQLNIKRWKPVQLPAKHFLTKLSKPTFLKERKFLIENGWIIFDNGSYSLGKNFLPGGIGKDLLPGKISLPDETPEQVKNLYTSEKKSLPDPLMEANDIKDLCLPKTNVKPNPLLKTEMTSGAVEELMVQNAETATDVVLSLKEEKSVFTAGSYQWMEEHKKKALDTMIKAYLHFIHPDDLKAIYPAHALKIDALITLGALTQPKRVETMTLGDAWESVALAYPDVKFELRDEDRAYFKFASQNWDGLTVKKRINVLLALKRKRQNGCTPHGAVNDEFDPHGYYAEIHKSRFKDDNPEVSETDFG